jgi:multiple sugar transport system permease protein
LEAEVTLKRKRKLERRERWWGLLFISPNLILFIAFFLIPILATFFFSFTKWDLISPPQSVGIVNYRKLFLNQEFRKVLFNTFYFSLLSTPLNVALPLALAVALNQKLRGMAFYRTIYFLPVVSSMVAVSLVWLWLYNPDFGLINAFLRKLGLPAPGWITSVIWAMPSVVIVTVWKGLGFYMMIFLAALQDVPESLIEAAKIDGANFCQRFLHVTVPMISPAIFFVVIMSTIWGFQTFDQIFMMTQGGPLRSTTVLVYDLYREAFEFLHMGYASAIAVMLLVLVMVVTIAQWIARSRWVHGEF